MWMAEQSKVTSLLVLSDAWHWLTVKGPFPITSFPSSVNPSWACSTCTLRFKFSYLFLFGFPIATERRLCWWVVLIITRQQLYKESPHSVQFRWSQPTSAHSLHCWVNTLEQGCQTAVLEGRCPAGFPCFPAPTHLIQIDASLAGLYRIFQPFGEIHLTWNGCVEAGKRLKPARHRPLRTVVWHPCSRRRQRWEDSAFVVHL